MVVLVLKEALLCGIAVLCLQVVSTKAVCGAEVWRVTVVVSVIQELGGCGVEAVLEAPRGCVW